MCYRICTSLSRSGHLAKVTSRLYSTRISHASLTPYIKELKQAIINANSSFECSGTIKLDGPMTLLAKVPASENQPAALMSLEFPIAEPSETSLQPLLDACVPAAFGRGPASVLDPAYRQALVLPTDIVALHAPGFNLNSILEVVEDTLVKFDPNEDKVVTARFDKLNVYGPGGFFKPHASTPRSKEMFASLVLALPCAHTGGELVLRDRSKDDGAVVNKRDGRKEDSADKKDESRVFSWGANKNISWVAFFSDTAHEVLPVTQGYRVTLTYNLFVEQRRRIHLQGTSAGIQVASPSQEPSELNNQPTVKHPLFDALVRFVSSPDCFPEGGDIGIHLENRYVFGVEDTADSVLQKLRGVDFFLYKALVALNLRPTVHYVIFVDDWGEKQGAALLDESATGQTLINQDVEEEYFWDMIKEKKGKFLSRSGIQVVNKGNRNFELVQGHYANQPSVGLTYGSVLFRVKIPAAKGRIHG